MEDTLEADFQKALADFPYQSFGDLPSQSQAALPSTARGQPVAAANGSTGSSVHQNWLLAKTVRHVSPSTQYGSAGALEPQDFLAVLDAHNVLEAIRQSVQSFITYLTNVFKDPKAFLELTIVEFLQQAEDLLLAVLDLLDDLIQALLGLIEQGLNPCSISPWTSRSSARCTSSCSMRT